METSQGDEYRGEKLTELRLRRWPLLVDLSCFRPRAANFGWDFCFDVFWQHARIFNLDYRVRQAAEIRMPPSVHVEGETLHNRKLIALRPAVQPNIWSHLQNRRQPRTRYPLRRMIQSKRKQALAEREPVVLPNFTLPDPNPSWDRTFDPDPHCIEWLPVDWPNAIAAPVELCEDAILQWLDYAETGLMQSGRVARNGSNLKLIDSGIYAPAMMRICRALKIENVMKGEAENLSFDDLLDRCDAMKEQVFDKYRRPGSDGKGVPTTLTDTQKSYIFAAGVWLAYKRAETEKHVAGETGTLRRKDAYPIAKSLGWKGNEAKFHSHVTAGTKPNGRWLELSEKKSWDIEIPK